MFIQVIQGKVADAEGLRAAIDRWGQELQPGATGWLGTTGGITDDGTFVATVRFDSEDAARRNSQRPEQGAWWARDGEVLRRPGVIPSIAPRSTCGCRAARTTPGSSR